MPGIAGSYRRDVAAAIATAAFAVAASATAPPAGAETGTFRDEVRAALSRGRDPSELRAHVSEAVVEIAGEDAGRARTVARRRPRELREEIDLHGVRQVVTLLGDDGWIEDANGGVRPLSGDELFTAVVAHALLFHDYLDRDDLDWRDSGAPRAARLEWSGRVLSFDAGNGPPARLEFGAGGLPRRFSQAVEGGISSTTYLEWEVADGVRFPFASRQSTGDERFDLTLRTTTASYPDTLPPDAVPRPAARTGEDVTFRDPAAARDIAVETIGGLVLVPVRVDGTPASFLLDTGSGATVLDAAFARDLGLDARGTVQARGAGGSDAAAFVVVDRLEVPGVELAGQTVVALDLGAVADVIGREVNGVLGYDFLSRFAVRLDYPRARLGLFPAGSYAPDEGASRVPLRIESNVPRVEAELDGTHRGSFLVDTGNSAALLLHSPFVRAQGLRGDDGRRFEISGVGGRHLMESATFDSLRIGDRVFRRVPALLARTGTGAVALHGAIGNVGGALFEDAVLAFDYSASSLWIARSTADSASSR